MPGPSQTDVRAPFAFESITVSNAAAGIGFTAATAFPTGDSPCDQALVTVETNDIRYRFDGIAPSATVGHKAVAGSSFIVYGTLACKRLLMIRVSADATVMASYSRQGDR